MACQQALMEAKLPSKGAFTRGASEEIVKSMRDSRLREMFSALDATNEGVVDGSKLGGKLSMLPEDVAEALTPMLPTVSE